MTAAIGKDAQLKEFGREGGGIPFIVSVVFSVTCGLSVASVYYAQPLLDILADEFDIARSVAGSLITATQAGYAVGLIAAVPLGDVVNRRRLILTQTACSAILLVVVGTAPTAGILLFGLTALGCLAVVTQVLVAYAAFLARPDQRGQAVGIVTAGVIVGIIAARTFSGSLADALGWRYVYLSAGAAVALVFGALYTVLPHAAVVRPTLSYSELLRSTFRLLLELPLLRVRAVTGLLIFAVVNMLWTPLVLPLTGPPFYLTHTEVGLFGLVGAMGALGAINAGRWADQGYAQTVSGWGLLLILLSWIPIALMYQSLWFLLLGILVLDFALQAVHVSNQILIFEARPEARSRLVAIYMVFYSTGCATGSLASTLVYASFGWPGVCIGAASMSAAALAFWAVTRGRS